jgi:C4-dicarboxylate transporter DctM subunit
LTNVSVGRLFVAGIVPGILLAVAMSITVHRTCRRMNYGTRALKATWRDIDAALRKSAFALAIPVIVVGGIRFGVFTPTEAGAVAVAITLILGLFVYRELRFTDLPGVLARTAVDTGVIMLIISFSAPVALVLAYNQIPQQVAAFFGVFESSDIVFLLVVNVFLLVGGALMEGVTLLILTAPLLASVANSLGIDPIHFGIVVIMNVVLGSITPPFGQIVFMVSSLTETRPEQVFRQVLRFLPLLFVVLGIVTYLPQSFLWTVELFGP